MVDNNYVTLTVDDGYKKDFGKQIVRLDSTAMDKLGIVSGDIVEIEGKKKNLCNSYETFPRG